MFEFISEITEDDLQNTYNKPSYDSIANRQATVSAVKCAIDKRMKSIRGIINNPDATNLSSYELETLQAEYSVLCKLFQHYLFNSCARYDGDYYSDCLYVEEPVEEPEEPVEEPVEEPEEPVEEPVEEPEEPVEEPVEEPEPVFEYVISNHVACTVEILSFTDDLACIQYLKHDRGCTLRELFDDLIIKRSAPLPSGGSAFLAMRASDIADCWFDDVFPEVE